MTAILFQESDRLLLLWLIPILAAAYVYAARRRRCALQKFIAWPLMRRTKLLARTGRRSWGTALMLVAIMAAVLGLARPGWTPKPNMLTGRGRDVVFLIDVSKSMLAEDLAPNRLERAKLLVKDCVERFDGHRIALVAFAGNAIVKCPLTFDYGFFCTVLEELSTDSISRGGSMIGDAIRKTLETLFRNESGGTADILLISDGEDQDSSPMSAARAAADRGVRIIAVGLGDDQQGHRIPVQDEHGNRTFTQHDGLDVLTKLDPNTLRNIALATPNGRYLPVATGTIALGDVYLGLTSSMETQEHQARSSSAYEDGFQIFLGLALVALAIELIISDR